jgi:signal peptidase I
MLGKVFKHFVAPRAEIASAKLKATLRGQTAIRVLGQNMEPGIPKNSVIKFTTTSADEPLRRNSIVVLTLPDFGGHPVPSRLVALEGDRVSLVEGQLFLNGAHVDEPYVQPGLASSPYSTDMAELVVPAGTCFLLGDYRDASKDSRVLGPIPRAAILGVVPSNAGEA